MEEVWIQFVGDGNGGVSESGSLCNAADLLIQGHLFGGPQGPGRGVPVGESAWEDTDGCSHLALCIEGNCEGWRWGEPGASAAPKGGSNSS